MRMCAKCVLPATYRNIRFDSEGVCNYCRTYERLHDRLTDYDRLAVLRDERFDRVRGVGDYDCLVGLSGGKDSSWIALQLAQKHDLKCLGFTFDNGFLTDYAKDNIKLVVEKLGIDHFFWKIDQELHRRFYEQAVRHFGTPCPGCSYSSYAFSFKAAFERKIPLVVHGRSRSQMFRELLPGSVDAFVPFVKMNLMPYDNERNRAVVRSVVKKLEYFVTIAMRDPDMRRRFYDEFFPPPAEVAVADTLPEFMGYFLYQAYDERVLMAELEDELGWKRPENSGILTHADCEVHDAAGYLFRQVFEYSMLCFELSVMIREGDMTRDEALARLDAEPDVSDIPDESLGCMCEKLAIDRAELPGIAKHLRYRNRWRNRYLRIKNFIKRPTLDLEE